MKYIIAIITCISLQGCFYQSVDSNVLIRAKLFCESKQSTVALVSSHAIGVITVKCLTGDYSRVDL